MRAQNHGTGNLVVELRDCHVAPLLAMTRRFITGLIRMVNRVIRIILPRVNSLYTTGMKRLLLFLVVIAAWIVPSSREASGCNVCHSKNPKMVRMHQELGFKDCFNCHGQALEKSPEKQKAQMTGDPRCVPCHKKQ